MAERTAVDQFSRSRLVLQDEIQGKDTGQKIQGGQTKKTVLESYMLDSYRFTVTSK